jgi:hypothetical protein
MVFHAPEEILSLEITRVDTVENNALNKIDDVASYTFAYTFDSSLITSDEENGWWIDGPYDLILSLGGGCKHEWKNTGNLCTNT